MNILYITSARLPTVKAHGYQIVKTCEALARQHHVVLLVPLGDVGAADRAIHGYYSAEPNFEIVSCFHLDVPLLRESMQRSWFAIHLLTFGVSAALWTIRHRQMPDIVYSRDPLSLYLLRKVRRFVKIPLVYESHEFPAPGHSFQIDLAKKLDGLVVVTTHLGERFVRAGVDPRRVLVEPDAVDLTQFNLSISRDDARCRIGMPPDIIAATYTGRFHTMGMEKGIPEIIDAAKILVPDFPNLRFYFVGGPKDREEQYRTRIAANGVPQERFLFVEKQPVADLPFWLKASDILLMPHPKNVFFSFDVSPLKMYEYMAARRPIVGSRLPAIEEILSDGENALLAEPGNAESLARKIRILLDDRAMGERLSKAAFERVQSHTWNARAKRIAAFASELSATP
jgi:glycosyltransferase involved in cell wall biosynthesis